ncbi:2800_t:CDS:2, partial [Funneliformis geosporum]
GFEKQLEERETLLKQKEINIKKTIEVQIAEKHKCLKDEYNTFKFCLENNLERQYKFRINALDKSNAMKNKEIGKLSITISLLKNDKNALKKDFAFAKKTIKVLDGIIYSKDQTIIAYNEGLWKINPGCIAGKFLELLGIAGKFPELLISAEKKFYYIESF